MKMLHVVCGKGFEEEIIALFRDFGLRGYTMISGVGGGGVTGTVSPSDISANTDTNTLFMVALDFESTYLPQILDGLREVRAKYTHGHHDREIPLKVFLQPCEIIM